ncbi:MAG TPA: hypothetical protein VGD74_01465, partial [Vulgatibacter sp.]
MRTCFASLALFALTLAACGDDESSSKPCTVGDPGTCSVGFVCEPIAGKEEPDCFAPVELRGRVFDLDDEAAIAAARVHAEEAGGRPVGDVATTDFDGNFTLRIPSVRKDASGAPVGQAIRLGAAARDYVLFPSGLRVSLPIDTAKAEKAPDGAWVIRGSQVSIGLDPLPENARGRAAIFGKVEAPKADNPHGTLVVAESWDGTLIEGRADASGAYALFNVPDGSARVSAWRRGANYDTELVDVEQADVAVDIGLSLGSQKTATLGGSVAIVSGNGATSIVIALLSTFDHELARGTLVPGLRAPEPGVAPNVSGAFQIDGIPDGNYVVLAAFENDGLVRDPDPDIAGTQIQRITVSNGEVGVTPSFKVTSAVKMVGPGAGDSVETISGTPTFRWEAYPSAKSYLLELFDTYGRRIWDTTVAKTSVDYAGP